METQPGQVLARRLGSAVQFRVVGRVTADHSPEMRRFSESAFEEGAASIAVDLRDCTNFDSTFLGTLLMLSQRLRNRDGAFTLVAPSAACRRILGNTGVARLFPIDEEGTFEGEGWTPLQGALATQGTRTFQENIVAAHRALVEVGGALGERYRDVIEHLERELQAKDASSDGP